MARCKLREFIEREGINTNENFPATTTPGTSFQEQANVWITNVQKRKRKPVKPATIFGWRHALDKWILPNIGEKPLAEVSNGVLKELIATMQEGLAPKTIVNYCQVVKMVVASAVNKDGDQIYPRVWNHDFCELPIVHKEQQHRPTVTQPELNQILAESNGRYSVMFALLAGTGLRIGEALALKDTSLSPDCRMIYVRRSIWHGNEQDPKTPSAIREVDVPEPLAALLRKYVAGKSGCYLFATRSGRPMAQRNLHRALHETGIRVGFHAFRRFRTETLRRARVPGDLERLWLGHTQKTITDLYAAGLQQDREWRREWVERAGLGFSLNGLHGATNHDELQLVQAA